MGQEKEKYGNFIMNKRQVIASLKNIANKLDNSGLYTEANTITKVMTKLAQELDYDNDMDPPKRADLTSIQPYNFNSRISPTQGVTNPEDASLVNKSNELLDQALKILKPKYEDSIPYNKLKFLRRETIAQPDNTPQHKKLPEARITDFADNINSKYKYVILLKYLDEFYNLCEAIIPAKLRDMQLEINSFNWSQSEMDSYQQTLQSFLEEIQDLIDEVEMIRSDYQDNDTMI